MLNTRFSDMANKIHTTKNTIEQMKNKLKSIDKLYNDIPTEPTQIA